MRFEIKKKEGGLIFLALFTLIISMNLILLTNNSKIVGLVIGETVYSEKLNLSFNQSSEYALKLKEKRKFSESEIGDLIKKAKDLYKVSMMFHKKDIMELHNKKTLKLIKEKKVVTTSEVASFLKVSWNTAEKYLLELALEGKVLRLKKIGVNLWVLK